MTRGLIALVLACFVTNSAFAAPRHHRRTFCTPVFIEGVGTVRICAPARGR